MILKLNLGRGFSEKIRAEMEKEIEIAQGKWKTFLSDSEKEIVLENSVKQLEMKLSFIASRPWKLSDKAIYEIDGLEGEYMLPRDSKELGNVFFTRTSDSWIVDNESKVDSILFENFLPHLKDEIMGWAKTAVFYGVGSYKK